MDASIRFGRKWLREEAHVLSPGDEPGASFFIGIQLSENTASGDAKVASISERGFVDET